MHGDQDLQAEPLPPVDHDGTEAKPIGPPTLDQTEAETDLHLDMDNAQEYTSLRKTRKMPMFEGHSVLCEEYAAIGYDFCGWNTRPRALSKRPLIIDAEFMTAIPEMYQWRFQNSIMVFLLTVYLVWVLRYIFNGNLATEKEGYEVEYEKTNGAIVDYMEEYYLKKSDDREMDHEVMKTDDLETNGPPAKRTYSWSILQGWIARSSGLMLVRRA
ncbi:uncharacterized protein BCR38DRAFT_520172 [Pseudomassariella vexata]|uniref:Uncharacterized protein n=1 Tax=Pseudomassariella vexata TaxID=1141098 RepID=A0A1Y2EK26_9PEZI|nr:uncharacterized protein BCR38DRAFT_520172 [Pseudomassariella vexata]ORY71867.1 hypothetical protein BCR38DRAFT_520172 [Pseudomassariella vexata]